MKGFVGIDFDEENVPGATMLLNFRHLLKEQRLQKQL
jgi:hypothetical protein